MLAFPSSPSLLLLLMLPACSSSPAASTRSPTAGPYNDDVLGAYNTAWSAALIAQGFDMVTSATKFLQDPQVGGCSSGSGRYCALLGALLQFGCCGTLPSATVMTWF